jgi:hypothetical protein
MAAVGVPTAGGALEALTPRVTRASRFIWC